MNDQELRIKCLEMSLYNNDFRNNQDQLFLQAQRIYDFIAKTGDYSPDLRKGEEAPDSNRP